MEKIITVVEKYWKFITTIVAIITFIGGLFTFGYKILDEMEAQNELIESTAKLALKSLIWNRDIPKVERAENCDIYLSKGYNSYTKKLCENNILKDTTFLGGNDERDNTENSEIN